MKAAVVAHYDPDSIWDENFLVLLRVLVEVADQTIVVTTAGNIPDLPADLRNATLVRRPNVGYDFYSYRVGVHVALSDAATDGLFILNSSLMLLNADLFRRLLRDMSRDDRSSAARGLTSSSQIGWHLQSYLLYFDLRYLPRTWLQHFFHQVEPVNSKSEVVLQYEIGLGRALRAQGVLIETLFRPTFKQAITGAVGVMRSLVRAQGVAIWMRCAMWRAWREVNWTHFGAGALAQQFGIVKTEFLRSNPHKLSQQPVWDACSAELRQGIEEALDRTRSFYRASRTGLTELTQSCDPLGIINLVVESPQHQRTNTRIAVVVHLYYLDLFEEILDDLANILEPFDLFITTPFEADLPHILDATDRRRQSVAVVLTKNQGRDVGPFIALFRTGRLDRYEAVLKLHSKKSRYSDRGDFWRRELCAPLCGSSLTVLRSLALLREQGCGVVGPGRYFLTHPSFWGANCGRLITILRSCGAEVESDEPELAFFAGTMFWFVPAALAAIHCCEGASIAFEPENGDQDGTLAHAWERAFCLLARAAGYRISSIRLGGSDVFAADNALNSVPVLDAAKLPRAARVAG